MNAGSPTQDFDARTIKLMIGLIALSLASLTNFFATSKLTSISASYYEGGLSQTFFIGCLSLIGGFLFAYRGTSRAEGVASRVAALAAFGVAGAPCECSNHPVTSGTALGTLHYVSAAVMFLVLTFFCYSFWRATRSKRYRQAKLRGVLYALCGVSIALAILVLVIDGLLGHTLGARLPRLTFYMEQTALAAFGISWLVASEVFPVVTRPDERTVLPTFIALREEMRKIEEEVAKGNLTPQQTERLRARHSELAGRFSRLDHVESAGRIVIVVAVALLLSGIVWEVLGLG